MSKPNGNGHTSSGEETPHPLMYVLDESGEPVPARDLMTWGAWMERRGIRTIARTRIGPVTVSTIFTGIDQRLLGDGPPLLFETMIFEGGRDGAIWRYVTREEAIAGHAAAVKRVEESDA